MRQTVLGALSLTLMFTAVAYAQAPEEPKRWNADAGLSLNSSGGNQRLTVVTATFGISHLQTEIFELGFNTRFRYGESEGDRVAQNLRGDISLDIWPEARWSPFLFATAEQDPLKKLDARLNGGAGAKRTFISEGWNEVSVSGAVLYSYENLAVPDSLGDGVTQTARWSWRARGRKELTAGNRLEQVVFYQPAWDDLEDYQIESITRVRITFNRRLAFTTELLYQRDSTPAPDVGPDDYSLSVGLSVSTQW
jgi:hypothetical protein